MSQNLKIPLLPKSQIEATMQGQSHGQNLTRLVSTHFIKFIGRHDDASAVQMPKMFVSLVHSNSAKPVACLVFASKWNFQTAEDEGRQGLSCK